MWKIMCFTYISFGGPFVDIGIFSWHASEKKCRKEKVYEKGGQENTTKGEEGLHFLSFPFRKKREWRNNRPSWVAPECRLPAFGWWVEERVFIPLAGKRNAQGTFLFLFFLQWLCRRRRKRPLCLKRIALRSGGNRGVFLLPPPFLLPRPPNSPFHEKGGGGGRSLAAAFEGVWKST